MSIEIKAPTFPESVADGTVQLGIKSRAKQFSATSYWSILKLIKWYLK